jgi:hypothetical protein
MKVCPPVLSVSSERYGYRPRARDQVQGQTLSNRDTKRCFPPRKAQSARGVPFRRVSRERERRGQTLFPTSQKWKWSGVGNVRRHGRLLPFLPNFLTDLLLSDKCPE